MRVQNVADAVEALPIVEIIGVSLQYVYAGCWYGSLFCQGHQVVLLVPRLFGWYAIPSAHCGSVLRALRSAAVGSVW